MENHSATGFESSDVPDVLREVVETGEFPERQNLRNFEVCLNAGSIGKAAILAVKPGGEAGSHARS